MGHEEGDVGGVDTGDLRAIRRGAVSFFIKVFCGLGSESLDIFADAFKSTEFFLWTILVWRIMGFLSTLLSMSVSGAF